MARVAEECGIASHAFLKTLILGFLDRIPLDLNAYREARIKITSVDRSYIRAFVACAYAMNTPLWVGTKRQQQRAAARAEARARACGLKRLACVARSYRRRIEWAIRPEPLPRLVYRSLRTIVLGAPPPALWNAANDALFSALRTGRLGIPSISLALALLARGDPGFRLHPGRTRLLASRPGLPPSSPVPAEAARHLWTLDLLDRNAYARLAAAWPDLPPRSRTMVRILSLGTCGEGAEAAAHPPPHGSPAFLVTAWAGLSPRISRSSPLEAGSFSREHVLCELCLQVWQGRDIGARHRRYLARRIAGEPVWARRLVLAVTSAEAFLRHGEARRACRALGAARNAHRGLDALCRSYGRDDETGLLADYEALCARTLAAFEPAVAPGRSASATVARLARRLPLRRHTPKPDRVLDALDAVITAGRAAPGVAIERRVARDLAHMLGGWILLHYERGRYLTLRPQSEHTLSTWTVHGLARERHLRARRIRRRPEFWRPDQRRPRAVLSVPLGEGVVCIARHEPYRRKEVEAVRTVLRFMATHRAPTSLRAPGSDSRDVPAPAFAGEGLIGRSRAWQEVLDQVARVATARCPIVLHGETGTGKECLARAIHAASHRSQGPFVAVNCGAIAPEVLGSELFGHVRGAFTGAERNRRGLLSQAHTGTLFLDEIADMPAAMQVALLRVLEERKVTPVGGSRPRPVDLRVLCASHVALADAVERGRFREDLFHRLNVMTIHLPPLRRRGEDVLLLAHHILRRTTPPRTLHRDAPPVLLRYAWPGNVRELDNVLRAGALLVEGPEITPEILETLLAGRTARRPPAPHPARLGPRSERILVALGHRWLSAPALARALGVSARTVNRELRRLLEQGMVEAHGEARARAYRRAVPEETDPSRRPA
ncbi:MAG: sigma 54-interacting transcriptional regulator [Planctomycetota bacterium]